MIREEVAQRWTTIRGLARRYRLQCYSDQVSPLCHLLVFFSSSDSMSIFPPPIILISCPSFRVHHQPPSLHNPRTLHPSFTFHMPIQRIHPRKLLPTPLTLKRPKITTQLFMSLTVMLSRKPFPTSRPMTFIWLFLEMGT